MSQQNAEVVRAAYDAFNSGDLDAAIVDINLRQGERSYGLIDRLIGQGVPVIVTSGYSDLPKVPSKAHVLEKPVSEKKLITILRSVAGAR